MNLKLLTTVARDGLKSKLNTILYLWAKNIIEVVEVTLYRYWWLVSEDQDSGLFFGNTDTVSNSAASLVLKFEHWILITVSKCSNIHCALTFRDIGNPFFINKKTVSASKITFSCKMILIIYIIIYYIIYKIKNYYCFNHFTIILNICFPKNKLKLKKKEKIQIIPEISLKDQSRDQKLIYKNVN